MVTSFGLDPLVEIKVILFGSTPALKKLQDANPDIVKGIATTIVELLQLINKEASCSGRKSHAVKKHANDSLELPVGDASNGGSQPHSGRSSKKASFFRLFKAGASPRSAKKEYDITLKNLSITFPSDSNVQYDFICIDTNKISREALVLAKKPSMMNGWMNCFEADEFKATTSFEHGEGQQRKHSHSKSSTFTVKGVCQNGNDKDNTKKPILGSLCIDFAQYVDHPAQKVDLFLNQAIHKET